MYLKKHYIFIEWVSRKRICYDRKKIEMKSEKNQSSLNMEKKLMKLHNQWILLISNSITLTQR